MTATIHPHPRAAKPSTAYPAAFGSATGPGFLWAAPAAPVRPASIARIEPIAAEIAQPVRRAAR